MKRSTLLPSLALLLFGASLPAAAQNDNEGPPDLIQVPGVAQHVRAWSSGARSPLGAWSFEGGLPELAPQPVLVAPTAFTPDGDGLNDKYFPHLTGFELRHIRFQVFDRWGHMLFTSNSQEGWDGTLGLGGAALPQGVYVWRLEAWPVGSDERMELAGSVTLIR